MKETSIFTKIRLGEVPGEVIHQEDNLFVVMTIAPHHPGHCLIVPVEEIADFEAVPKVVFARMMDIAQQLARLYKKLYSCPKVAMVAAGMEVPHTHIHIFALHDEQAISPSYAKHPPMADIHAEADKIRAALKETPVV